MAFTALFGLAGLLVPDTAIADICQLGRARDRGRTGGGSSNTRGQVAFIIQRLVFQTSNRAWYGRGTGVEGCCDSIVRRGF